MSVRSRPAAVLVLLGALLFGSVPVTAAAHTGSTTVSAAASATGHTSSAAAPQKVTVAKSVTRIGKSKRRHKSRHGGSFGKVALILIILLVLVVLVVLGLVRKRSRS
ncbi:MULTISPECIES: hypothetical protein [unclassified Streptomyces]|uniref:hypothetical protein n=1 Tax=unclassified Streptomyces TaxID=2593676 RepID=UPI000DC561F9|nr:MULTISPECIES: hypothetical protein [unclassified Streptomyces]MYT70330.1 hypothetical protein [Streptomyces sp. SID8367]RAJ70663.1 hypothetical protein K377_07826 [Streptomyces sp. PsTaAH-137]